MPKETVEHMPKFSFVMIVLNGMPFIECALRAIYAGAQEIVIVEGAVADCMFAADANGSSTDGTVEAIKRFPDHEGKIRLFQGKWPEKLDMHNKALEAVSGDYVWLVDSDEIYHEADIERVRQLLHEDPTIARVDFIPDNFWKGFDYTFVSAKFAEDDYHYRRVFRYSPDARFISHRPPTLSSQQGRVLNGRETRALHIYPYHYSYVLWNQVYQKVELYHRYGWGKQWGIDLDLWFRDFFLQWKPEKREELESAFAVWTGDAASRSVPFTGEHPAAVAGLIRGFSCPDSGNLSGIGEEEVCAIVGAVPFQKMVLRAWEQIQLDEPLVRRYGLITDNVEHGGGPFWNIHVALAFLSRVLRPESYLEIGVRTGGSMVQVLHNAAPRHAMAVDQWSGDYAGMPNTLSFTRSQFADYQQRSGNRTKIRYRRGNSHKVLKTLISENRRFDLITVDGDHTRDGAWEDLEDAIKLLSDRGAIVFDDIIHVSHRDLYTLSHRLKLKYPQFSVLVNSSQDNGCTIFLKNIDIAEALSRGRRMVARTIRVAGEEPQAPDANLTSIDRHSSFARSIADLFEQVRPERIIETGTFHGEGTTRIIASCLVDLKLEKARFLSIECNRQNLTLARANLAKSDLSDRVELVYGLSVPRRLLPSREVIEEKLVHNIGGDGIFVDHDAAERTQRYYAETGFRAIPEDRLGHCLALFNGAPDFVLLDSGGHMGNIEFNHLLEQLRVPCHVALDDINHVKHARSFRQILKDPRFSLTVAAPEKFGFCIARFVPTAAGGPKPPKRILWIRTDAIGDTVLSLPALARISEADPTAWISVLCQEHVAELYAACPFVDEVLTFERRRAQENAGYRKVIVALLRDLRADICITPVLSRDDLTDSFAFGSRAKQRIAFDGNDCNIDPDLRRSNNRYYTRIVAAAASGIRLEKRLYQALLAELNIPVGGLDPQMWLTLEDEEYAAKVMEEQCLDPARTVAFFPGAQDSHRHGREYGAALEDFCGSSGYAVVALGSILDREIVRHNSNGYPFRVVDLTGKTTIRQAAAIIARCAAAVGAETGLAHVAAAVGTPHVVLLGGGHFGRFMPYAATTTAVTVPLECFGCNWHCRFPKYFCISGATSRLISAALRLAVGADSERPRIVALGSSCWPQDAGLPRWDLGRLHESDLAVTITVLESDGEMFTHLHGPNAEDTRCETKDSLTPVSEVDMDLLLARSGLETEMKPFSYLVQALSGRLGTGGTRAALLESIGYLKRWLREQRN